jgi:hypothetical protein
MQMSRWYEGFPAELWFRRQDPMDVVLELLAPPLAAVDLVHDVVQVDGASEAPD